MERRGRSVRLGPLPWMVRQWWKLTSPLFKFIGTLTMGRPPVWKRASRPDKSLLKKSSDSVLSGQCRLPSTMVIVPWHRRSRGTGSRPSACSPTNTSSSSPGQCASRRSPASAIVRRLVQKLVVPEANFGVSASRAAIAPSRGWSGQVGERPVEKGGVVVLAEAGAGPRLRASLLQNGQAPARPSPGHKIVRCLPGRRQSPRP